MINSGHIKITFLCYGSEKLVDVGKAHTFFMHFEQ